MLAQVLRPIHDTFRAADFPDLLIGLDAPDDAAVYRISDDLAIVQTVDFFPPVVDDPYTFGAVAAANAMSDVYAMGGEVLLALQIAGFPDDQPAELLAEIFRGGAEKVAEAGGVIAGGHTIIDAEPKYGLCVTGTVRPDALLRKSGAQPGDVLLLTKALGTGIVLTAARDDACAPEHLQATIDSMLRLNRHPAHLALEAGVHACTDVTGFGLLGHAEEMAHDVRFVIDAAQAPALPGALDYARAGQITGGAGRNREGLAGKVTVAEGIDEAVEHLLFDAQTSGGLLLAVPPERVDALAAALEADGFLAARIGRVEAGAGVVVEANA
ncbi:MAG: selenide, water dikinase SelD [Chloroflexi bacterium]|nr:selenide, water dikinase SelD [Chloroflexota bacterium]